MGHCKRFPIQYLRGLRDLRATPGSPAPHISTNTIEEAITGRTQTTGRTYREAGVDIDAGAALVEAIKPLARSTQRAGTMGGLGGFAGLFDLKAAGYRDPLIVVSTDGVGTKLKLAIAHGSHEGVGIDLVAMSANDVVVSGAEPLVFLDYFATARLDLPVAEAVLRGIAEGCRQAGCALLGGETAEMPGMYARGDYDLAGFVLGAVERDRVIDGRTVAAGDAVLGLASSGVHSNGYSLVRRIIEDSGLALDAPAPFEQARALGDALLAPTRIYVRACLAAIRAGGVKALAHITGGGLVENIPRVVPSGLAVELDPARWTVPPVFRWLAETGNVAPIEMARTFNCGIGMVLIVAQDSAAHIARVLSEAGENVSTIGRVVAGKGPAETRFTQLDAKWPR